MDGNADALGLVPAAYLIGQRSAELRSPKPQPKSPSMMHELSRDVDVARETRLSASRPPARMMEAAQKPHRLGPTEHLLLDI